jgi:hypothetical protein
MKTFLLAISALALTVAVSPAMAAKKYGPQSCEAKCATLISTTRQAFKREQCVRSCHMYNQ